MAARKAAPQRISLSLVFVKAYALVAARRPELRQVYVRWPLPHLYQYRDSVAIIATHRQWRDESWLFLDAIPTTGIINSGGDAIALRPLSN